MAWIAVACGRAVARWVLHPIALYFVLLAPAARRRSARYLGRALGRPARWSDVYRHVHAFASTVLDRVYFVRGQLDEFQIDLHGGELMEALISEGRGAVLLGAHIGSFEALHALGTRQAGQAGKAGQSGQSGQDLTRPALDAMRPSPDAKRPGPRVAMVMYPDNARMIQSVLRAIAPGFHLDIIPIGRRGSTLAIRDWLDAGGLAGMLGDRFLPAQNTRGGVVLRPFLGHSAQCHDGPLRLAQLLHRPVVFMVGLYRGGRRYEVRFEHLADFSQPSTDAAERERQLDMAMTSYVRRLETVCRDAPYNWFNFHDFWNEDASH